MRFTEFFLNISHESEIANIDLPRLLPAVVSSLLCFSSVVLPSSNAAHTRCIILKSYFGISSQKQLLYIIYIRVPILIGGDLGPSFRNTFGNLCKTIKKERKCPFSRLILPFYPLDMAFEVSPFLPIIVHCNMLFRVTFGYIDSIKKLFGCQNFIEPFLKTFSLNWR